METDLYRKQSLEQLSNPEALDDLLTVTNPVSWISLSAIGIVILSALVWGIFGTIPYKVEGSGIIINSEGVLSVVSTGEGQISGINVKVGDVVEVGQVIATVSNPQLIQQFENAKQTLDEQRLNTQLAKSTEAEGYRISLASIQNQIKTTEYSLNVLREQLKLQERNVEEQKKLLDQELVAYQDWLNAQNSYNEIRKEIITSEGQLKQLKGEEITARNNLNIALAGSDSDLLRAESDFKLIEVQLKSSGNIVSPYKGKVVEITSMEGSMVNAGTSVVTLEAVDGEKEAVIFVPTVSGKKLSPGMEVDLSPSTVEEEQYGFMRGKVISVSEYPASNSLMMELLDNESLVNALSEGGAPFLVRVELIKDSLTYSGFKWSTKSGPNVKIGIGTVCTGSIVTQEIAPISLVIPLIKKYTGI